MNKLVSVRMPEKLLKDMDLLVKQQGYTPQELIRESLREFILKRKSELFFQLAGSKKSKKVSKKDLNALAEKLYH